MKITVLIPSDEYRRYAGSRIRYGRLRPHLTPAGADLELLDIAKFDPQQADCDVLIISKCHDSRAIAAAATAAARGCRVGLDLFDDYFTMSCDSRLVRFRRWLGQIVDHCQFALCSTPAMVEVIATYRSNLPVHVVNDPGPGVSTRTLRQRLRDKMHDVQHSGMIRILWFGLGDNPYFNVGLHDLAANCTALLALSSGRFTVDLTVLTNERALTAEGLQLIASMPVRTRTEEWTERREIELLNDAFACFLPVNAHPFSAAKSLNRAVTALSAGCQVLTVGHPLYDRLGDFIYRDGRQLGADLEGHGAMRHGPDSVDRFRQCLDEIASPAQEAQHLRKFLESVARPEQPSRRLAIVHGHATDGLAHTWVQANDGLSIASPFCRMALPFDVVFEKRRLGLEMFVSDRAAKRLLPESRDRLGGSSVIRDRAYRRLLRPGELFPAGKAVTPVDKRPSLAAELVGYTATMQEIHDRTESAFGPQGMIFSEDSRLPFNFSAEPN